MNNLARIIYHRSISKNIASIKCNNFCQLDNNCDYNTYINNFDDVCKNCGMFLCVVCIKFWDKNKLVCAKCFLTKRKKYYKLRWTRCKFCRFKMNISRYICGHCYYSENHKYSHKFCEIYNKYPISNLLLGIIAILQSARMVYVNKSTDNLCILNLFMGLLNLSVGIAKLIKK